MPAGPVERAGGFVEQPEGAIGEGRADQPGPALLPPGQLRRRPVDQGVDRHETHQRQDGAARETVNPRPENQGVTQGLVRLQPVRMAQPGECLGGGLRRIAVADPHRAGIGPDQTGEGAQQGGLAGTVGADQKQGAPGREIEIQSVDQPQPATRQGKAPDLEGDRGNRGHGGGIGKRGRHRPHVARRSGVRQRTERRIAATPHSG